MQFDFDISDRLAICDGVGRDFGLASDAVLASDAIAFANT
jgi:hypothetical protein